MYLDKEEFIQGASILPLAAIDLVIIHRDSILMGLRQNSPGKGSYFVPGGRIRKQEIQKEAFERIWSTEALASIPKTTDFENANLLGVFDHIYETGPLNSNSPAHYVVNAYTIHIQNENHANLLLKNTTTQHSDMRWINIVDNEYDLDIHKYSLDYINKVK